MMSENKAFEHDELPVPKEEGQHRQADKTNNENESSASGTKQKNHKLLARFCSIDTHMIPSKIAYSLSGAYTGSFVPFINVFLTSIGLSESEAGFIGGMRLVSSTIAGPLWGFLADHTGYRKLIFTGLCLCTALTIFSLPWMAKAITITMDNTTKQHMAWNAYNAENDKYVTIFSIMDEPLEIIEPVNVPRDVINRNRSDLSTKSGFSGPLFYSTLIMVFVSNIFDVPSQGFVDSFVMNVAKSRENNVCYGMQRVFGSVSFGVANFIAGIAADHYDQPEHMSKYTAIFYVFLPCIILLIPSGLFLLNQTRWPSCKNKNIAPVSSSKTKIFVQTFRKFDNMFFIICVFLVGIASAVLLGFLFMLMDKDMDASKTTMGFAVLISCLVQVLLFPFADKIIERFGALPCIEIAMFSYFIRFMLVSYITEPWLIIPTQLFHCFGFALFWAAAIEHTQNISPKEIYVTMYSILSSVYYGIGGVVGNVVGGIVYTHYGGRMLFRTTAVLCGIWTGIMIMYYQGRTFMRKKGNVSKDVVLYQRENKDWPQSAAVVRGLRPTM